MDDNVPEGFHSDQILQLADIKASILVVINLTLLVININEEHLETSKSFCTHVLRVKQLFVAHDVIEHFVSASFIQQIASVPIVSIFVLFCQEQEEFLCFILGNSMQDIVIVEG